MSCNPAASNPATSDLTPSLDAYLTAAEAAERLGRPVRILRRWAAGGRIPGVVKRGGIFLIPATSLPLITIRKYRLTEKEGSE